MSEDFMSLRTQFFPKSMWECWGPGIFSFSEKKNKVWRPQLSWFWGLLWSNGQHTLSLDNRGQNEFREGCDTCGQGYNKGERWHNGILRHLANCVQGKWARADGSTRVPLHCTLSRLEPSPKSSLHPHTPTGLGAEFHSVPKHWRIPVWHIVCLCVYPSAVWLLIPACPILRIYIPGKWEGHVHE